MDWPARSPDLNPIDHVWDFLGRRLAARTLPPVTIRELRLALQDEWSAMPQQLIDTLILSMGRRCETCLAVREIISPTKDRMFLAGHPSQGCFGLQSHCAPCYFFNQASFYPSDFSFNTFKMDDMRAVNECSRGRTRDRRVKSGHFGTNNVASIDSTPLAPSRHPVPSRETIRRRLTEVGLRSRRPLRRLPLTPHHRQCRLDFCRLRATWSVTNWRRVIFSDESRFSLSADDHRTRVWRRTGQRSDPAFIVEWHTAISQGVTVWEQFLGTQDHL
ncbi:transposable element Tcb2 transposase [Trichonephila clavipes]|nr:transposable element Tcb2 transposase [Trichonephila clavipes]